MVTVACGSYNRLAYSPNHFVYSYTLYQRRDGNLHIAPRRTISWGKENTLFMPNCFYVVIFVYLLIPFAAKVRQASVLFVDNPVGSGFSYVDESIGSYTTNIDEITDDLISFSRQFIRRFPQFLVR